MNESGDATSTNPDGPTPATDPELLRRLDQIVVLQFVIAIVLVHEFIFAPGEFGFAFSLLAGAIGLLYLASNSDQTDE